MADDLQFCTKCGTYHSGVCRCLTNAVSAAVEELKGIRRALEFLTPAAVVVVVVAVALFAILAGAAGR